MNDSIRLLVNTRPIEGPDEAASLPADRSDITAPSRSGTQLTPSPGTEPADGGQPQELPSVQGEPEYPAASPTDAAEGAERHRDGPTEEPQVDESAPADGEGDGNAGVSGPGREKVSSADTSGDAQFFFQETLTEPPIGLSAAAGPLLPFGAGVLAALAVTGLLLWLRRRSLRRGPATAAPCRGLRSAQVHELGARDSQQDAFCVTGLEALEGGVLAAVADGMGGLVNSGQISRALTNALVNSFAPGGEETPARQLQLLLGQALEEVERQRSGQSARSGSTLVMCLVRDGGLSWLSVGDSRICLWRSGGLIQLNRDHDFHHDLTLMALQGDMTFSEADADPRRENLTSYIGGGFPRKVEWNPEPVPLLAGDRVVLMSDGVYRALTQGELSRCLEGAAEKAAGAIRRAVEEKGLPQQDNFTAVILEAT